MRIHHLNCGTMNPPTMPGTVCHVFLCETDRGLVLVDSGFGTADLSSPAQRLGPARFLLRPDRDEKHTALRQVEAMGFSADDVSDVVLTHLDADHIGGLSDFPGAVVHTTTPEYEAAVTNPGFAGKQRFRPIQWAHQPRWKIHEGRGDEWKFGLTAHEVLPGFAMIPMPGHTKGMSAVAVDAGERGLMFHAGDAVFDASCIAAYGPAGTRLTKLSFARGFEKVMAADRQAIQANHSTLARLQREDDVTVVPAHDKRILHDLQNPTSR